MALKIQNPSNFTGQIIQLVFEQLISTGLGQFISFTVSFA
jgi:hypothetical protein